MKKIYLLSCAIFVTLIAFSQAVSDFQNLGLAPDTFWNGSDLSGGFSSGNAYFENSYNNGSWFGFAYSDVTDNTTPGPGNQYSAITGGGYNSLPNYAVVHDSGNTVIKLTGTGSGRAVAGFLITNSTYTYLSMLNGYGSVPAFTNADWLELTVTGWYQGNPIADSVNFYLAYDSIYDTIYDSSGIEVADTALKIVNNWQWINLRPLGNADSLVFILSSSQLDSNGHIVTPAYFCLDNLITTDIQDETVTINYEQDTVVKVVPLDADTSSGPFTVQIIGGPDIDGASALVDSVNEIWYIPTISIVAVDTLTYLVCNSLSHCDTGQIFFNITDLTGIKTVSDEQYHIYPNPFNSSFTLYHTTDIKEVRLYDLQGRLVETCVCNKGDSLTQIDAANLAAGTYFVRLISDETNAVTTIIKQ
jgi:hypothetical protein